jgi:transposase
MAESVKRGPSTGRRRERRPTLATVAEAAGVSRTTVSNAYNRPDQLAPELRERVLATAASLGYTGPDPAADAAAYGIELRVVKLPEAKKGFVLLPRRWVAERRLAWLDQNRRLSKDYEELTESSEAWVYLASIRPLLRRRVA